MASKDYKVSRDDFSTDERIKRKQWDKMMDISLVQDTGILEFNVYYKTKEGAEEYAKAIADTLMNRSTQFYGASDIIKIRVINAPLTSDNIAKPKIVLNVAMGLLFGIFAAILYVYFTIESKDNIPVEQDIVEGDKNVDKFNNV